MYYLAYGFFYILSLLPFPVIYLVSDFFYLLLFHVIGYRKKLVLDHLQHTFPEKTEKEREKIAGAVFRNFCDVWVELIKMISMTRARAAQKITFDFAILEKYYAQGKSVQIVGGHFMNWEYINVCMPLFQPFTTLAIYMPLTNKAMERLVFNIRSKFGMVLLKAGNMASEMKEWNTKQYAMVVGADQSPSNLENTYWLMFCNRPTGFIDGPWKRAVKQDQPYVYFKINKPKRGHYHFSAIPFADNPMQGKPEDLALKYARMLEEEIRETPELYLWTHKRWKKPWKPEYASKWIDSAPLPVA